MSLNCLAVGWAGLLVLFEIIVTKLSFLLKVINFLSRLILILMLLHSEKMFRKCVFGTKFKPSAFGLENSNKILFEKTNIRAYSFELHGCFIRRKKAYKMWNFLTNQTFSKYLLFTVKILICFNSFPLII